MKTLRYFFYLLMVSLLVVSCDERDFDTPPMTGPVYNGPGANITIKELKAKSEFATTTPVLIENDYIIKAYVGGNDESGNIYKQMYVQDEAAGITLSVDKTGMYGAYKVGQLIYIHLKGLYMGQYGGVQQIGTLQEDGSIGRMSIDEFEQHVFRDKLPSLDNVNAIPLTINSTVDDYVGMLVKIENVTFVNAGRGIFAPKDAGSAHNEDVRDVNGNSLTIRTSTYANFAGDTLPEGPVTIYGILSKFNSTPQFFLRTKADITTYNPEKGATASNPITVDEALEKGESADKWWVRGVIVGSLKDDINETNLVNGPEDFITSGEFMPNSIVIATSETETEWTKYIVVELPAGTDARDILNLSSNPGNIGKEIVLNGLIGKYLGAPSVKLETGKKAEFIFEGSSVSDGSLFFETFGSGTYPSGNRPKIAEFTNADMKSPILYSDPSGNADIRSVGTNGAHVWFPANRDSYFVINGINTSGYKNVVLSFELAANLYDAGTTSNLNAISVKCNGVDFPLPSQPISNAGGDNNKFYNIELPNVYSGEFVIEFISSAAKNTVGLRLDNIKITGEAGEGGIVPPPYTPGENPNPEPEPEPGTGAGTKDNPYSVASAITKQGQSVTGWVQGYIVGVVNNGVTSVTGAGDVNFTAPFNSATNVLVADSPTETDYTKCVVVNLPSGSDLRNQINLQNNASNLGAKLKVNGTLRVYFGLSGLRDSAGTSDDFVLEAGGSTPQPDASIFNEPLTTQASFDKFTAVSVTGALAWKFDARYGAVMSGYDEVASASRANEDWFISPAINLSGKTSAKLTFDHARGPAGSMSISVTNYTLWVSTDYTSGAPSSATWTQLTIPTHGTAAWGYVSSGEITIPTGNANTRIAFKYLCTDAESATWEVKDVVIK